MQVEPYLFFNGACDEALAFYTAALGAEVETKVYFRDAPDQASVPPEAADGVMHAAVRVGGTRFMASDGCGAGERRFEGFSLALDAGGKDEAARLFAALAEGGDIEMPLGPTFFAGAFGIVRDRFGVGWFVIGDSMG